MDTRDWWDAFDGKNRTRPSKAEIELEKLLAWYVRHVHENEGTDFLWPKASAEERQIAEIALKHGAYDETWDNTGPIIRPDGKSDAQRMRERLAQCGGGGSSPDSS